MYRQQCTHRRTLQILICFFIAAPIVAQAGLLDSLFKKSDAERPPSARYDRELPLVFDAGALTIDITGHWKVGGSSLTFTSNSIISSGTRELDTRDLHMGQDTRMMGYRLADGTVAVRRLRVVSPSRQLTKLGTLTTSRNPVGALAPGGPR